MKRILFIAVLIAAFSVSASAQRTKGFGVQAEVGYNFKLSDSDFSGFQIAALPGYHFNPYLFAGAGLGYNSYSIGGKNMGTIPVFAHITANFTKDKTFTPFASAKLGYSFGSLDGVETGFYGTLGIGVKYKVCTNHAISLSAVWDQMEFKVIGASSSALNNAIGIRLGYEF